MASSFKNAAEVEKAHSSVLALNLMAESHAALEASVGVVPAMYDTRSRKETFAELSSLRQQLPTDSPGSGKADTTLV